MAVLPDELTAAAALRAEWFVTDYFTADVDPSGSASVRAALPPGGSMPELPQDEAGPGVSFVEWARTVSIEPLGNGIHRVEVLFRAIGAPESGEFRRLPVRAVAVGRGGTDETLEAGVVGQGDRVAREPGLAAVADTGRQVGHGCGQVGDGPVPES